MPLSGPADFDQADSASNLAVSDPARPATKILPSFSAFGDGIGDAGVAIDQRVEGLIELWT